MICTYKSQCQAEGCKFTWTSETYDDASQECPHCGTLKDVLVVSEHCITEQRAHTDRFRKIVECDPEALAEVEEEE